MKLLEHSGFLVRERAHHFSRYDAAAFVRGNLKHQYVTRFEVRVFGGQVLLLLFGEQVFGYCIQHHRQHRTVRAHQGRGTLLEKRRNGFAVRLGWCSAPASESDFFSFTVREYSFT